MTGHRNTTNSVPRPRRPMEEPLVLQEAGCAGAGRTSAEGSGRTFGHAHPNGRALRRWQPGQPADGLRLAAGAALVDRAAPVSAVPAEVLAWAERTARDTEEPTEVRTCASLVLSIHHKKLRLTRTVITD